MLHFLIWLSPRWTYCRITIGGRLHNVFLGLHDDCISFIIHDFAKIKKNWLNNFLILTGGIPSAMTYKRVFSIIKPDELENICVLFAQDVLKLFSSQRDIMNIDGKTDNGSRRNENEILRFLNILVH